MTPMRSPSSEHGDAQDGPVAGRLAGLGAPVLGVGQDISDVHSPVLETPLAPQRTRAPGDAAHVRRQNSLNSGSAP